MGFTSTSTLFTLLRYYVITLLCCCGITRAWLCYITRELRHDKEKSDEKVTRSVVATMAWQCSAQCDCARVWCVVSGCTPAAAAAAAATHILMRYHPSFSSSTSSSSSFSGMQGTFSPRASECSALRSSRRKAVCWRSSITVVGSSSRAATRVPTWRQSRLAR